MTELNEKCERSQHDVDVIKEIEDYNIPHKIHTVNRDGDKFFITCPECDNMDLTSLTVLGCKRCHTQFTLYFEDGYDTIDFDSASIGNPSYFDNKLKLIELDGKKRKVLYGRNNQKIDDIKSKYPNAKIVTLCKDLQKDGKDAHGHGKYKRYALIPLN